jgi:hypothetical protein
MNHLEQLLDAMDKNPALGVGVCLAFVLLVIVKRLGKRRDKASRLPAYQRKAPASVLDKPLFLWTQADPFTIRDLLNGGVAIFGRAGSGKTSASGRMLLQAIVNCVMSAGLILAAKPEDKEEVIRVFRRAGRLCDLIIFEPGGRWLCNFLQCLNSTALRWAV